MHRFALAVHAEHETMNQEDRRSAAVSCLAQFDKAGERSRTPSAGGNSNARHACRRTGRRAMIFGHVDPPPPALARHLLTACRKGDRGHVPTY
jgi:hypothetical protein